MKRELIDEFIEQAKHKRKTIVFPESRDERILTSAWKVQREGICNSILIGEKSNIYSSGKRLNLKINEVEIIEPTNYSHFNTLVDSYLESRPNLSRRVVERLLRKELIFGGMLVATGVADGMVAGAINTTATVIQSASLTVGYQEGISTPSSFFIMSFPNKRVLFYADCAVNIDPTPEQLAEIGISTARSYKKLMNEEPKVAFLSFSTKGSATHALVEKVRKAVEIAKLKAPEILLDGEFQADTALSKEVAAKKLKTLNLVAGNANVLIFPDLNAGNISYKLTQYLAGAHAYGPILQGFSKPVSDLSRGASVEDIIGVTALTCLQT